MINANSTKMYNKNKSRDYVYVLKFLIGTHIAKPSTIKGRWESKGAAGVISAY